MGINQEIIFFYLNSINNLSFIIIISIKNNRKRKYFNSKILKSIFLWFYNGFIITNKKEIKYVKNINLQTLL